MKQVESPVHSSNDNYADTTMTKGMVRPKRISAGAASNTTSKSKKGAKSEKNQLNIIKSLEKSQPNDSIKVKRKG